MVPVLTPVPRITRYDDIAAFLAAAETFLMANEAANNLILSVCGRLLASAAGAIRTPYLATATVEGVVSAAAMHMQPHHLVLSDTSTEIVDGLLADVHRAGVAPPGILAPVAVARAAVDAWQRRTGQSWHLNRRERLYRLDEVTPIAGVHGRLRPATLADREQVILWGMAFGDETGTGGARTIVERGVDAQLAVAGHGIVIWESDDGVPLSMAGFTGMTPHGVRVNYVYTPPDLRGHGYASACVAALSQHLLDSGRRFCCLFSDLSNATANRLYQTIGYLPVVDVDEYHILPR